MSETLRVPRVARRGLAAVLAAAALHAAAATAAASLPTSAASSPPGEANPMLCQPRPDYPKAAASRGVQGTSIIDLEFAADGTLAMARIAVPSGASPEHTLLDEAALAAVQRCRLARAEPAPTTRRITYSWKLDEGGTTADYMKELERAQRERLAIQAADDARLSIDAEHGVAVAQLALARQYADGERRERNDKLASTWFRKAAEGGDADAQVYYGQRLMAGKGVSQDDEAGIAWLRKAAAQGSGAAAYGLGIFTRAGRGVRASDSEAFRWFLQGARAGTIPAILETADAYAKGAGTPRDDAQAVRWYQLAAPRSYVALYRLGLAYRDGLGVTADYERAAFCMAVVGRHGERAPTAALATIVPHLDAATTARVQARADAWNIGDPLFP